MLTYKIGDRVIVKESNVDFMFGSYEDKVGTIVKVLNETTYPYNYQVAIDNDVTLWCKVKGYAEEAVVRNDFKVGDRVYYNGENGTVKCIKEDGMVGVEFDTPGVGFHNCGGFKLIAGDYPTRGNSLWLNPENIFHFKEEVPKYYNGKVVCVAHYYPNTMRVPGFAIGKIYDVVDGRITNDEGWQSTQYESVESLSKGMGNTFLKVVE